MAYDPNCAETKTAIQEAIAEATAGLVAKRDELLGEVRTLKAEVRAGGGADQAANIRKIEQLEGQLEKTRTDLETATTNAKKFERDLGKANAKVAETETTNHSLVTSTALKDAMDGAKIATQYRKAVEAMHKGEVKVVMEDGKPVAKIGDKDVTTALKEWAASDEGKAYVGTGINSGSGAPGNDGKGNGQTATNTMLRSDFNALNPEEQHNFIMDAKNPGTVVDAET